MIVAGGEIISVASKEPRALPLHAAVEAVDRSDTDAARYRVWKVSPTVQVMNSTCPAR